jgi:hypothetical protein
MLKQVVDYENMLYPQNQEMFNKTIPEKVWFKLQEEATRLLAIGIGSDEVKEHWRSITRGKVPFNYSVLPED